MPDVFDGAVQYIFLAEAYRLAWFMSASGDGSGVNSRKCIFAFD
jgi:hypothetical protein